MSVLHQSRPQVMIPALSTRHKATTMATSDRSQLADRRPAATAIDSQLPDSDASPLEMAIGKEAAERYERALAHLRPEDRAAIVARVEMDCSNEEIAIALGKPSANAARMAVERALVR